MSIRDIAIIGMSCRFPGADNYQEYWGNLVAEKNSVRETPLSRWDWRNQQAINEPASLGFSRWAGFIDNPEYFDPAFFGISPREAECMDPQQRLMLEQAWHCIQDAGTDPRTLAGKNIGVFIAAGSYDYKELQEQYSALPEAHEATGVHNSVIANRISYFFNFHGPSVVVDTACSSSLVAMQQAASAIQLGQCESALVGGVGLLLTPTTFVRFGKMGMLSPTGECAAFDTDANGYVRGEGAGVVMLKPLAQAQADGNRIWGVIKSVAINHGGKARTLTSPSARAQAKLIIDAVQQADIPAHSINFIETHGTGTPLGDPIEIHALTRAFNQLQNNSDTKQFCGLGAVKANIGHLECAAGMAGLIKVLLALKHKTLPGHASFKTINPRIKLEDSPFHIVENTRPWHSVLDSNGNPFPLRAGISSFGFGGVNGHLIVEQSPEFETRISTAIKDTKAPVLLTISAASAKSLQQLASAYSVKLAESPHRLNELCAAANQSQPGLIYRKSIVANDVAEVSSRLSEIYAGNNNSPIRADLKIAFVFSGQGSQYPGMGADFYTQNSAFRTALDECDRLLQPLINKSIITIMFDKHNSNINLTQHTQPALFALEYALAKMWQSLGINPDYIVGHSIGELTGACIAGVFSLEDAIHIVVKRGQLMGRITASGKMAAIFATETEVKQILQSISSPVDIAAFNSPNNIIISGDAAAIDSAVAVFEHQNIEVRSLEVSQAFHSASMEPILEEFRQVFKDTKFSTPKIKLISNLTGNVESQAFCSPDYWLNHARSSVQYQAGIATLIKQGITHLLEIGPSSMMTDLAKRTLEDQNHDATLIISMKPDESSRRLLLEAAGQLFEAGYNPDFTALTGRVNPAAVQLPLYPFDHHAYWIPVDNPSLESPPKTFAADMPGRKMNVAAQSFVCFEANPTQDFGAYLLDHKVKGLSLMPAAAYISCASAALGAVGVAANTLNLSNIKFHLPLFLENAQQQLQTMLMRPNGNNTRWDISIAGSSAKSGNWQIFTTAEYTQTNQLKSAENMRMRLWDDFELMPSVSQHNFYQQCFDKGLEYGPGFQAVTHAIESDGKAYGCLRLPESCNALSENCFAIHPSLLDGALQLVTLLAKTTDGEIPLPVGIAQFTLYRSGDKDLLAVAELSDVEPNCADILLYTREGKIVGDIRGLQFRWTSAAQIVPSNIAQPAADFYFAPEWREHHVADSNTTHCNPLIIYSDASQPLVTGLKNNHPSAILCRINDEPALERFLEESPVIDRVYFIVPPVQADDFLLQNDNSALVFLLNTAQRLLAKGYDRQPIQWLILSTANHRVHHEISTSSQGLALAGFARSLCREQSRWSARHIDLESGNQHSSFLINCIENAVAAPGQAEEYAVRGSQYWYRELVKITPPQTLTAPAFRTGGVYLITGGAQGIGAALAMKLAQQQSAKLILLGRSARDVQRIEFEQQLKAAGGDALYLQADVADYTKLRAAVLQAVQQFGPIHGVIHSAGVINDGLVQNITSEMLNQVCAPKIQGTVNLYRAINDQPLDFLLLFSSVMSWLAYAGQANYVAANAFVDGFTHAIAPQSRFPVKVINWGHWGETGMASSAYYRERIARLGIHEISTHEGLAAIETAISNRWSQLIVMKAQNTVLVDLGVKNRHASVTHQTGPTAFTLPTADQLQNLQAPETQDLLLTSLGTLIAKAMRMNAQQLLNDKSSFVKLRFTSLGIDSLTSVDLRKRIRDWLGVDVPAALLIGGASIGEIIDLLKQQLLLQRLSNSVAENATSNESNSEDEEVFLL